MYFVDIPHTVDCWSWLGENVLVMDVTASVILHISNVGAVCWLMECVKMDIIYMGVIWMLTKSKILPRQPLFCIGSTALEK